MYHYVIWREIAKLDYAAPTPNQWAKVKNFEENEDLTPWHFEHCHIPQTTTLPSCSSYCMCKALCQHKPVSTEHAPLAELKYAATIVWWNLSVSHIQGEKIKGKFSILNVTYLFFFPSKLWSFSTYWSRI